MKTTSAVHRREIFDHIAYCPSKPPEAFYCLGCDVQTLAWNSKSYNLDQGFLFRLSPISSPSSISSLIISPCRLIFSKISQLLYFQACAKSAHLVCGLCVAFFVLPVESPSVTHSALPLERGLLEERVLDFFIQASPPASLILNILKRICEVNESG